MIEILRLYLQDLYSHTIKNQNTAHISSWGTCHALLILSASHSRRKKPTVAKIYSKKLHLVYLPFGLRDILKSRLSGKRLSLTTQIGVKMLKLNSHQNILFWLLKKEEYLILLWNYIGNSSVTDPDSMNRKRETQG